MGKVRYEEMLPHEIRTAREERALAYLPLGTLEWHGPQNAVGLDGLKAHALCCEFAAEHGGLVHVVLLVLRRLQVRGRCERVDHVAARGV